MKPLATTFVFVLLAASAAAQQRTASRPVPPPHPHPGQANSGQRNQAPRPRTVYFPYAYPVAVPDYYNQDQPAPPPVVINQTFVGGAQDQPRDPVYYPNAAQPAQDYTPRLIQAPAPTPQDWAMSEGHYYLIAAKDHSVYTALAFWMEAGALHYVTPQNAHNQITPDLIDLDLTKRLNAGRGLAFNLVHE